MFLFLEFFCNLVNFFLENEENIENFVILKDFSPLFGIKKISQIKT
jgi:hypothetical protein